MFSGIGFTEMIVLGVVAVLLFGSRLPEVAKNLGRSYNEFRRGLNDLQSTIREENVVEYLKQDSEECDDSNDGTSSSEARTPHDQPTQED